MRDGRTFWQLVAGAALVLTVLWVLVDARQARRTAVYHVALRCHVNRVTAAIDGQDRLTVDIPPDLEGNHCGLYVYHPSDGEPNRQWFRHLVIRDRGPAGSGLRRYHLLDPERDGPRLNPGPGWRLVFGRGLWHSGDDGERATLLLPHAVSGEFDLAVDLDRPCDAGLIVRAASPGDGLVCVVRPLLNDVFFFRLTRGVAGPVRELVPLQNLTAKVEAGRLLGEWGVLGLRGGCVALLLWFVVRLTPVVSVSGIQRRWRLPHVVRWVVLAGFPLFLTAWIGRVGLQQVPHLADETAYWFQARIYASGRLWAPVPAWPDFFQHDHILMRGDRWMAKYPPMFPLLLALGMRAHVPWLVNPLLAGVLAAGVYHLAAGWAGRPAGWAAWGLLVSSPFFLFMGANLMTHLCAATFLVLFLLAGRSALRTGRAGMAAAAGAAMGAAMLTRPFTAAIFAAVSALYAAGWALRRRGRTVVALGAAAVAGGLPFVAAGAFWLSALSTGDAEAPSLNVYALYDRSDTLGFGPEKGKGWLKTWGTWGHSPAKALRSARFYMDHTSRYLFGWPWQLSLMWIPVPFILGRHRGRYLFLLAVMLAIIGGHMFYWATQHIGYGARYWFTAVPLAAVLSGIGVDALTRGRGRRSRYSVAPGAVAVLLFVAGLMAWNAAVYMPARLRQAHAYGNVTAQLHQEVMRRGLDKAVVFVQTENLLFNDGFFMNDPQLKKGPVFARDLGPRNGELLAAFPGYRGYLWDKVTLRPIDAGTGGEP